MKKLAKDLTDKECKEFVEEFYLVKGNPFSEDDEEHSSKPWGAPWYLYEDVVLKGKTIKHMAENYFLTLKDRILKDYDYCMKAQAECDKESKADD